VRGRYGGCVFGFNKKSIRVVNIWGCEGFLGFDLISPDIIMPLRLNNIYGPCHSREVFWERLFNAYFMQADNMIIGGNLNFSLGISKSWGNRAQTDPLTTFFEIMMDSHDLLNIDSENIVPTWRNRRTGEDALARRLDHFLLKLLC